MMKRRITSQEVQHHREEVAQEKAKLALEIAISEAELERKPIRDAIQRISDEMRDASHECNGSKSKNQKSKCASPIDYPTPGLGDFLQGGGGLLGKQHSHYSLNAFDGTELTETTTNSDGTSSEASGNAVEEMSCTYNCYDEYTIEEFTIADDKTYYTIEEITISEADDNSYYEDVTIADESSIEEGDDDELDDEVESLASFFDEVTVEEDEPSNYLFAMQEEEDDERESVTESKEEPDSEETQTNSSPVFHDPEYSLLDVYDRNSRKILFEQASSLARLCRLSEHTIESVSSGTTLKPNDSDWQSAGLLSHQTRLLHREVLQQAADKGASSKLLEYVVSNYEEKDEELTILQVLGTDDQIEAPRSRGVKALSSLFETGSFTSLKKSTSYMDPQMENSKRLNSSIKTLSRSYLSETSRLVQTVLPIPSFRHVQCRTPLSGSELAKEAAVAAWERQYRSRRRVKITSGCPCAYCATASPQQTYAYQQMSKSIMATPKSDGNIL